jgi:guanylate kinase
MTAAADSGTTRPADAPSRGQLIVLSGPSGVGKSTVADRLLADPSFGRAVTATTRAPRTGETDGVHYRFLDEATFGEWIASGRFLEWANVHGRRYGTPRSEVDRVLDAGRTCLLVIDVQGAATLRRDGVPALFVFLAPPDEASLATRLRGRGTESHAAMELRLRNALEEELPRAREFDAVVVNEDLERTVGEIKMLVSGRRPQGPGR